MKLFLFLFSVLLWGCGGISSAQDIPPDDAEAASTIQPTIKSTALTGGGTGNVAVDTGFASNGSVIAIPTGKGFTISDCKISVALASVEGSSLSTSVGVNQTTGAVVCKKLVQERTEVPPETKDCVVSYTLICLKNTSP